MGRSSTETASGSGPEGTSGGDATDGATALQSLMSRISKRKASTVSREYNIDSIVSEIAEDGNNPADWIALVHNENPKAVVWTLSAKAITQLYAKATKAIPLEKHRRSDELAYLWLGYARLLSRTGSPEDDVRDTYKFMKSEGIGQRLVHYFTARAEFERSVGNMAKCKDVLSAGRRCPAASEKAQQYEQRFQQLLEHLEDSPTDHPNNTEKVSTHVGPKKSVDTSKAQDLHSSVSATPSAKVLRTSVGVKNDPTSTPTAKMLKTISSVGPSSVARHNVTMATPASTTRRQVSSMHRKTSAGQRFQRPSGKIGMPLRVTAASLAEAIEEENTPKSKVRKFDNDPPTLGQAKTSQPLAISSVKMKSSPEKKSESMMAASTFAKPKDKSQSQSVESTAKILASAQDAFATPRVPLKARINAFATPTVRQGKDPNTSFATPRTPGQKNGPNLGHSVTVAGKRYQKLGKIGKGGTSNVFSVFGPDQQLAALKEVDVASADAATLQGYENEIHLLESLQGSPYIIKLHGWEINKARDMLYIVMECGDADLNTVLKNRKKSGKKLDENYLRLYWQQMLEAVQTVHDAQVVHADLKPANFLFVKGQIKLIDFGIARQVQDDQTSVIRDSAVGTLNYMAPEAITNQAPVSSKDSQIVKISPSTDVWSLGCILYSMAYGKTPFQHLNPVQKLQAIVNPAYNIEFPTGKNSALVSVLKSCLQRDAKLRPSISELLSHKFLNPKSAATPSQTPKKMTGLTQEQLHSILMQLPQGMVAESPGALSRRIFGQAGVHQAPPTPLQF